MQMNDLVGGGGIGRRRRCACAALVRVIDEINDAREPIARKQARKNRRLAAARIGFADRRRHT